MFVYNESITCVFHCRTINRHEDWRQKKISVIIFSCHELLLFSDLPIGNSDLHSLGRQEKAQYSVFKSLPR